MTAADVVRAAGSAGVVLATAESLTGGLVGAALTSVPGSSRVYRGGVVAYATELKHALLQVPADLLERAGPVDPDVAVAMAAGVARLTGADVGLATTGEAGPDPAAAPVGTVYVAVVIGGAARARSEVRALQLTGDRAAIRAGAVHGVLDLAQQMLEALAAEAG